MMIYIRMYCQVVYYYIIIDNNLDQPACIFREIELRSNLTLEKLPSSCFFVSQIEGGYIFIANDAVDDT